MTATFVEAGCTVTHEGRTFEAAGARLADCSDGYRRGVVYVKEGKPNGGSMHTVTTWHGEFVAVCELGRVYRGGFHGAKMRSVRFTLGGVTYSGRYGCEWADAVRVRSTRKVA